jgi:predicted solute-binding protein
MNDLRNHTFIKDNSTKPPLGLTPKILHDDLVKVERFNEVCGAIARYYDARLKIKIEWIQEYNELVDYFNKSEREEGLREVY